MWSCDPQEEFEFYNFNNGKPFQVLSREVTQSSFILVVFPHSNQPRWACSHPHLLLCTSYLFLNAQHLTSALH